MSTILIIDDIATNREVLVTLLGYYGHNLFEAKDGAAGLRVARAECPDLIIADVLMPTMDGYEFVRQLRTDRRIASTPVVFYTAHYLEKESRELAASVSVSYIIAKPAEPQEVLRIVDLALGGATYFKPALPTEFNREHLRLLTDKLAEKSATLRNANQQLSALIQLGQDFATEQDLNKLIQGYCDGARDIMGAAMAGIRIKKNRQAGGDFTNYFSSIEPADPTLSQFEREHHLLIENTLNAAAGEAHGEQQDTSAGALTADPSNSVSLLAVPLAAGNVTYGWMVLSEKLEGGGFDGDEAKLAHTIAAKMAVRYENALLYDELRAANQSLEARVAERTEELGKANAELQRSNFELEQYAYSASHDLQEPLRMIGIYSQLLTQRLRGTLDPHGESYLQTIDGAAQRMQVLVNDLLSYSTLVVNESDQEVAIVDLNEVCRAAQVNCATAIEESGAQVICACSGTVPGRHEQLMQVFQNLIGNAIRYRKTGVRPVICVSATLVDGEYIVAVKDNGIGFEMKYADLIFKLFKRLHGRDIPGTGIGLAICKRVVENHGGRLWVDSVPGEGSTFFFTLKQSQPPVA